MKHLFKGMLMVILFVAIGLTAVAPEPVQAHPARAPAYHHPVLSGTVACLPDGRQEVTWTIGNSQSNLAMEITAISRTLAGVPVGTVVPKSGSVQATEIFAANVNQVVPLTVTGEWPNGVVATRATAVRLKADCQVTHNVTFGVDNTCDVAKAWLSIDGGQKIYYDQHNWVDPYGPESHTFPSYNFSAYKQSGHLYVPDTIPEQSVDKDAGCQQTPTFDITVYSMCLTEDSMIYNAAIMSNADITVELKTQWYYPGGNPFVTGETSLGNHNLVVGANDLPPTVLTKTDLEAAIGPTNLANNSDLSAYTFDLRVYHNGNLIIKSDKHSLWGNCDNTDTNVKRGETCDTWLVFTWENDIVHVTGYADLKREFEEYAVFSLAGELPWTDKDGNPLPSDPDNVKIAYRGQGSSGPIDFYFHWADRTMTNIEFVVKGRTAQGEWKVISGCLTQLILDSCPDCGPAQWEEFIANRIKLTFRSVGECTGCLEEPSGIKMNVAARLETGLGYFEVRYQNKTYPAVFVPNTAAGDVWRFDFPFTWLLDGHDFSLWYSWENQIRLREQYGDVVDKYIVCSEAPGLDDIQMPEGVEPTTENIIAEGVAVWQEGHIPADWVVLLWIKDLSTVDYENLIQWAFELQQAGELPLNTIDQ